MQSTSFFESENEGSTTLPICINFYSKELSVFSFSQVYGMSQDKYIFKDNRALFFKIRIELKFLSMIPTIFYILF